jgi:hypothetical protein
MTEFKGFAVERLLRMVPAVNALARMSPRQLDLLRPEDRRRSIAHHVLPASIDVRPGCVISLQDGSGGTHGRIRT